MNVAADHIAPEEIMAFLDCELGSDQSQTLKAHIEQCAECSQVAGQLRATSQALSAWTVPALPKSLEDSINAIGARSTSVGEIPKPGLLVRLSFWSRKQWTFAAAGALATLLIVSAMLLPNLYRSSERLRLVEVRDGALRDGDGTVGKMVREHRSRITTKSGSQTAEGIVGGIAGGVPGGVPRDEIGSIRDQKMTTDVAAYIPDSNGRSHEAADSFSVNGQLAKDQEAKTSSSNVAPAPMIARTASLSIVVKDFPKARSLMDAMLSRHHGYSAQLDVSTPENASRSLTASLRIPAMELSVAVADFRTLGRVENESQSGEDVSKEHTDLLARLKTSRDTESRFRSILEQRTGNVRDVLQVEESIARVRGDIERMEAEQKALEHRVDFASVDLQLTEEFKAALNPPAPSVATRIHNALVAGYQNGQETLLGILLFFMEDGPTIMIWLAILAFPALLLWRRFRRMAATV